MKKATMELFSFFTLQAFIWSVVLVFILALSDLIGMFLDRGGWAHLILLLVVSLVAGHTCEDKLKPILMKWLNLRG